MPWGAAIGAIGSIIGGSESSSGAQSAANAQSQAALQAAQIQQQEFNTVQGLNAPGRNLGYGADTLLAQLYGIPNPNSQATSAYYPANSALTAETNAAAGPAPVFQTSGGMQMKPTGGSLYGMIPSASNTPGALHNGLTPGVNPATAAPSAGVPNFANFYNSPGYQFTLGQGEQALNRGAAAGGNAYSTNTLASLNNYAQGAASTQYNNYVQQLMGLAGIGGQAVSGTGSAALQTGANISNATMQAGAANASGILNSTAANNQMIQGIANNPAVQGAVSSQIPYWAGGSNTDYMDSLAGSF